MPWDPQPRGGLGSGQLIPHASGSQTQQPSPQESVLWAGGLPGLYKIGPNSPGPSQAAPCPTDTPTPAPGTASLGRSPPLPGALW